MNLPLVDVFSKSYESWESRNATTEEVLAGWDPRRPVRTVLNSVVSNAKEAAEYVAKAGADNGLAHFINDALQESISFEVWRKAMPSKTPKTLSAYQKFYPKCDLNEVSKEIENVGLFLCEGQYLFHGGLWPGGSQFVTDRPLSTTFCPQVALSNACHRAKAYDNDRIDLFVLRVESPNTKVFVYKRNGTNLGHENEVLFSAGAQLTFKSRYLVNDCFLTGKCGMPDKKISVYVCMVGIS